MDIDERNSLVDKRIRRNILRMLDAAKVGPRGGYSGRFLREQLERNAPTAEWFEDDNHVIRLCRDLVGAGFLRETDDRKKITHRFSLDSLFYEITSLGSSLRHQLIDKHPLVEDDRR